MKLFISYLLSLLMLLSACSKSDEAPKEEPLPEPVPEFETPPNEDLIIYEVNLRAFSQSGDIQGVIQGLDHIKSLGVNAIWLMPIHPIGDINSVNSPYSVKNYQEVGAEYGNMEDLIELVSKAHENDLAIMLDWVANHTAWDNPWITNTDWYTQDGSGNIISPPGTNWADVADLNFSNQTMRQQMIASMKYWIETADIDGFRCDAADMVPFDFWKQAIDSLTAFTTKDLIFLAEGGNNNHFSAGFDLNFGWEIYGMTKDVFNGNATISSLFAKHKSIYNNIPDGKQQLRFTTNHDESAWDATPMVIFNGKQGALAASALNIFLGGVPLIYDGQEVGVTGNIPFFRQQPIDWTLNPDMLHDYQEMLQFYTSSAICKTGELSSYNHAKVASFVRSVGAARVAVIVNTRNTIVSYGLPDGLANSAWIHALTGASMTLGEQIDLQPYEYLILKVN